MLHASQWKARLRHPRMFRSYVIFALPWTTLRIILDHELPRRGAAVPRSYYTLRLTTDKTSVEITRTGAARCS